MDYLQVVIVTRIYHRLPPLEVLFGFVRSLLAIRPVNPICTLSWMLVGRLSACGDLYYTDTKLLWYRAFPNLSILVSTLNKCQGRTSSKSNGIVRITMIWGLLSAVGEEPVGIVIVVVVRNFTGNPEGVVDIIIILQSKCNC